LLAGAGDVPLIQRLISELAIAGIHEVILSANDPQPYARFATPLVADLHARAGPLGGIEASLHRLASRSESVVFLPCDLPNLSAVEVIALVCAHESMPDRIVLAETAEKEHPLCAVVPVGVLPAVSSAIRAGRYGVGRLWHDLAAVTVRFDDCTSLLNINTPEDLRHWRQAVGGTAGL
jgi:molybdopterin-guanine dinucleotide biosynthesis protein A